MGLTLGEQCPRPETSNAEGLITNPIINKKEWKDNGGLWLLWFHGDSFRQRSFRVRYCQGFRSCTSRDLWCDYLSKTEYMGQEV